MTTGLLQDYYMTTGLLHDYRTTTDYYMTTT